MTIDTRKRINVKSLLTGELKEIITAAIDRGTLSEESALSLGMVQTLKLSKTENDKTEHDKQLSLAAIREVAKEHGISKNMSQGTASKIQAILYDTNKWRKRPDFYVNLIEYAIKTRVSAWINSVDSIEEIAGLHQKVTAFNTIVTYPILVLAAHAERSTQTTGLNMPALAFRVHRMPVNSAEAIILLLEDPENEFNALRIQRIIQEKNQKTLSYKMINDVLSFVEWVEEHCNTYSRNVSICLQNNIQSCNKNTSILLDSVIPHIALSATDKELSSGVIAKLLSGYYCAVIADSDSALEGSIMFD